MSALAHCALPHWNSHARGATPAPLARYVFVIRGLLKTIKNDAKFADVAEAGLAYANQNPDAFKNVIDGAVKKLLDEGLDQGKELESDRLGVIFASRVGYDPTAYETFLDRLRPLKGDDRAFFKTHPDFSNRLSAVRSTITEQKLKATGILLAERFNRSSGGKL